MSDHPRAARAMYWMSRHYRVSMAIGTGLILAETAIMTARGRLPWWPVAVAVMFLAPVVLSCAVYGRSRFIWLSPAALVMSGWCAVFAFLWVQQVLLQYAGHDESCSYVSSVIDTDPDGTGYLPPVTTDWIVSCPDGMQQIPVTGDLGAGADGLIPVRTVAGGALGAAATSTVDGNYTMWYIAFPGIAGTVAVLVAAIMTPRAPERTLIMGDGEIITL